MVASGVGERDRRRLGRLGRLGRLRRYSAQLYYQPRYRDGSPVVSGGWFAPERREGWLNHDGKDSPGRRPRRCGQIHVCCRVAGTS